MERINTDSHVYLFPEHETEEASKDLLRECAEDLIERELHSWWTDESDWPDNRNVDMLKAWFHLSHHSTIEDLSWDALEDSRKD